MNSLLYVSLLVVAITLSLIIPTRSFANTPGEPGYMPPPSTDRPIKFDCLIGDSILREIEGCKTISDGSSIVSSKLLGTKVPGYIETIIPIDIRKGMTDRQVGYFIGYKQGFEAGIKAHGKPGPPNAGLGIDYETGHKRGLEAGYDAGLAIQPKYKHIILN